MLLKAGVEGARVKNQYRLDLCSESFPGIRELGTCGKIQSEGNMVKTIEDTP